MEMTVAGGWQTAGIEETQGRAIDLTVGMRGRTDHTPPASGVEGLGP
jgi:hypothetical protein